MNKYRITLMALCMAICTQAKVTLPSFFTDNMVIQQKSTLILPGKAKAGKQVTVKRVGITENIQLKREWMEVLLCSYLLLLPEVLTRLRFQMAKC